MNTPLTHEEQEAAQRRFARVLLSLVVTYFLATLIFKEFWPFSRFPMFSRSGLPWTRALLRQLSPDELGRPLLEVSEDQLPGRPVALHRMHKNQDDLSAVVGKAKGKPLSVEQQKFLAEYFAEERATRRFALYAVRGLSLPDRTVQVRFRPIATLGPEGVTVLQDPSDAAAQESGGTPTPASAGAPDTTVPKATAP